MYASIEQARATGAVGDDAAVTAALHASRSLIDRYTGNIFEPTTLTVVARVAPDGSALLPYQVRAVTSVRPVGGAVLHEHAYTVLSSSLPGQVDAVLLGGQGMADMLVLGAEPWNGGWANLARGSGTGQVEVTGEFGPDETPPEVADAAAALAAARTQGDTTVARPVPVTPDVDDEGNAVSITVDAEQTGRRAPTTGLAQADTTLAAFVRGTVRVN